MHGMFQVAVPPPGGTSYYLAVRSALMLDQSVASSHSWARASDISSWRRLNLGRLWSWDRSLMKAHVVSWDSSTYSGT